MPTPMAVPVISALVTPRRWIEPYGMRGVGSITTVHLSIPIPRMAVRELSNPNPRAGKFISAPLPPNLPHSSPLLSSLGSPSTPVSTSPPRDRSAPQHSPRLRSELHRRLSGTTKMMMASKRRDNELLLRDCEVSRRQSSMSSPSCGVASTKRVKTTSGSSASQTESLSARERKDRIGERVAALQRLVSPFGKTDTASVLQEATDYIRFLHEQVQVLSSPYLQNPNSQGSCNNLRSRGLCLVPLSHTNKLASNNGADLWATQKH